ncbi:FAD-dependent oxidoreductase [Noviherbaspirillum denitrificans]|uniref:Pyridine nucleotide-disulfide oxidoreductase n=1 Tax=Noviherbaspirillum denitrificans TaxID=1968433 RepID=A0A254T8J4_9BURK|nr:FAD-dependent oxidoreductase [Noviherbaspirillum denitrificans]OWW18467.1 pyridine nucleotide-disulfide oxidoreductase [Noviherbaspirillum denitrificans]
MQEQPTADRPPLVKVCGRRGAAEGYAIRDFLYRCGISFEWIELDSDETARSVAKVQSLKDSRLPVCVFPDGSRLECPTIRQIIEKLGWFASPSRSEYDVAIYGAGPAGLSAAVYGAADGLKTVLVERWALGGQAGSSSRIENYLGFPEGISGAELFARARDQAVKFGVEILLARKGVRAEFHPGKGIGYLEDGTRIVAHASICATGVEYRRLGVPDEDRFLGAGVYYGAGASEATLTRDEDIYIVGGGNSAGQAAMYFAQFARRICIAIRGDSLKSTLSQYLIDRICSTPNIFVLPRTEVVALHGGEVLEEITLADRKDNREYKVPTRWLFVCIGGVPQTEWATEVGIKRDSAGYLLTGPDLLHGGERPANWQLDREPYHLETNVPGVFAAGDVRHGSVKRCASAVGEGAMAVALVHRYLSNC